MKKSTSAKKKTASKKKGSKNGKKNVNFRALSQAQVMEALGKTAARINRWREKNMPTVPGHKPALYDLADMWDWRVKHEHDIIKGSLPINSYAAEEAKYDAQIKKQNARRLKRNNDEREKKLVRTDQVCEDLRSLGKAFKSRAEGAKRQLKPVDREVVDKMVQLFIKDIKMLIESKGQDPEDGLFDNPPAKPKKKKKSKKKTVKKKKAVKPKKKKRRK